MSSNSSDYSHLKELGKSNYEIADGESDIRSWVVKNEKGNILGEVDELIFDSTARKAVFIVLNMDKNEFNLKERRVLLPLEYADLHEAYKNVVYKGLMPNELAVLPSYDKGKFTRNSIDLTRSTFLSAMGNTDSSSKTDTTNFTQSGTTEGQHLREEIRERRQENTNTAEPVHTEVKTENEGLPERQEFVHQDRGQSVTSSADKPYTVVGVFEQSRQTQNVIDYLLNHGFKKQDVTVSSRQTELNYEPNNRDESGITSFFKSLFNNDDEVKRYSDATERSYVVSVSASSADEAEGAARVLDENGCVNLKSSQQVGNDFAKSNSGNSRIFKRQGAN